jgi:tRNA nucleotidyltransferase/poly(A) polymerase
VRRWVSGEAPSDFECIVRATPDAVLKALPRAVVIAARARRLCAPTKDGPLDVSPVDGRALDEVLLHRDFTLHAMAYRPRSAELRDPHGGRHDLREQLLRTPGVAKERLADDPLRALRALRLVAQHGYALDPELRAALPEQAPALSAQGGRRVRIEIEALLQGRWVEEALTLLRECGLGEALAPGARNDAPRVVAQLPQDLDLRLAAWLRGARVRAVLRDLRCPRDRSVRIERLLQLHPVDAGSAATRETRARRLLRRDAAQRSRLLALRRAEIQVSPDPASARSLDRLVRTLDSLERSHRIAEQRAELCIGGGEVMEALGCGPGARVGSALRFLSEQVSRDPARNDPETLRRLLLEWDSGSDAADPPKVS